MDTKEDLQLLKELLYHPEVSRNKKFLDFEEKHAKRLHRIAKTLKSLQKELQKADVEYWKEHTEDGRVCIHLYQPKIGSKRTVFLTQKQFGLLFNRTPIP